MMSHTSGKWERKGLSVFVEQRGIICECPTVSFGGVFDVDANVSLIAAAPAMFAALEATQKLLDDIYAEDSIISSGDLGTVYEGNKQALAKGG